jgi:hypothetical protein
VPAFKVLVIDDSNTSRPQCRDFFFLKRGRLRESLLAEDGFDAPVEGQRPFARFDLCDIAITASGWVSDLRIIKAERQFHQRAGD